MTIETEDDVVALKRIGRIVSYVLQEMLDAAEPGMTTRELDLFGEQPKTGGADAKAAFREPEWSQCGGVGGIDGFGTAMLHRAGSDTRGAKTSQGGGQVRVGPVAGDTVNGERAQPGPDGKGAQRLVAG
jgi:hypothetical protein